MRSFACLESVAPVGGTLTLAWDVEGAGDVRIEPGIGEVPPCGTLRVPADPAVGSWVLWAAARDGSVQQVLARPALVQPATRLAPRPERPALGRRPRSAPGPVPVTAVPVRGLPVPGTFGRTPRPLPQPFAWRRRPAPRLRAMPVAVALPAEFLLPAASRVPAAE